MVSPAVENCCGIPFTGVYGLAPTFKVPPVVVTVAPLITNTKPGAKPGVSVRVYVPVPEPLLVTVKEYETEYGLAVPVSVGAVFTTATLAAPGIVPQLLLLAAVLPVIVAVLNAPLFGRMPLQVRFVAAALVVKVITTV